MAKDLTAIMCCHKKCSLVFYMIAEWVELRRNDHELWYCPNGHSQQYSAESKEEKLRRERDRLRQNAAYLEDQITAAERSTRFYKGQITKLKKRAGAGVCLGCNRTFSNLARHMTTKHPDMARASP